MESSFLCIWEFQSLPVTIKCSKGHWLYFAKAHGRGPRKGRDRCKNQDMFIWWLLKVGSGISLQNALRILVISKAPQPLPSPSSLFHDLFGTRPRIPEEFTWPKSSFPTAFYKAVSLENWVCHAWEINVSRTSTHPHC